MLVVAVVIVIAVVSHLREKKRSQELQEHARKAGWGFIPKDTADRPSRYAHYGPFGKGHSRYAFNVMTGTREGTPFEVFDYHYAVTTHNGKSSSTSHYYHKVCALSMPIPAPGLSIQKEHVGHKLMGAVGAGDIDFESDAFSRRYWVKCDDRRFAYDVIHSRTMEFLMRNPGWHWEWRSDTLLVHQKGKLRPAKADRLLELAFGFRGLLPRHRLVQPAAPSRKA